MINMDSVERSAAAAIGTADRASVPVMDSGLFTDSGIGTTLPLTEAEAESASRSQSLCFRDMMEQLPPAHRQGVKRLIGHAQRQKNPRLIGTRIAVEAVDFLSELDDYDASGFLLDCLFKRAAFDAATCSRMRLVSSRWCRIVDRHSPVRAPTRRMKPISAISKETRRRLRRRRHHRRATLDSSSSSADNSMLENFSSRRSSFSAASTVILASSRTLGATQAAAESPAPSTSSPAWHVQPPRRASLMTVPIALANQDASDAYDCAGDDTAVVGGGGLFDAFVAEGKRLVNRQFLRHCPRCRWPAMVDPDTRIGRCTRPEAECGFAFCSNCLADGHLYRHCPFQMRTSPIKLPPPTPTGPPRLRLSLKKRLQRL